MTAGLDVAGAPTEELEPGFARLSRLVAIGSQWAVLRRACLTGPNNLVSLGFRTKPQTSKHPNRSLGSLSVCPTSGLIQLGH